MSARVIEAERLLSDAQLESAVGTEAIYPSDADAVAAAQVLATLELAEQLRLANLIAITDLDFRIGDSEPYDALTLTDEVGLRALRPEIKEGLGL